MHYRIILELDSPYTISEYDGLVDDLIMDIAEKRVIGSFKFVRFASDDAADTLHQQVMSVAGEGGLNWRARLQEACYQYRKAQKDE
jgi:hypothetical protein